MANELQVVYATLADEVMRLNLITSDGGSIPVCNTKYEGLPTSGAVKIPVRPEVTVEAYNKLTGKALTATETAYVTVVIDEDFASNELCDGYDVEAVPDDMIADRVNSAAYASAAKLDQRLVDELVSAGVVASDNVASTVETAFAKLTDAKKIMSKRGVPAMGRVCLASPDFLALLCQSPLVIQGSALGDAILAEGFMAKAAGFFVKECAFLPADCEFICSHSGWVTRVRAWTVMPRVQSLDGDGIHIGASAVQQRFVFKHKVTRANAVYIKNVIAVTGVTLTPATLAIDVGETGELSTAIAPVGAGNKNVAYTSSDVTKATVGLDTGIVTGIAAGTATITVTSEDGGFTDTCVVTVSAA